MTVAGTSAPEFSEPGSLGALLIITTFVNIRPKSPLVAPLLTAYNAGMTKYILFYGGYMNLRILFWSLLLTLTTVSGCRRAEDVWPETGKKRVLVSFPPL